MSVCQKLTLVLLLVCQQNSALATQSPNTEIFESVDKHGVRVFSDRLPASNHYKTRGKMEIRTITWATNKVHPKKMPQKALKKSDHNNHSKAIQQAKCKQLTSKIKKLNQQLRQGLAPNAFESTKKKLRQRRGEYRKNC